MSDLKIGDYVKWIGIPYEGKEGESLYGHIFILDHQVWIKTDQMNSTAFYAESTEYCALAKEWVKVSTGIHATARAAEDAAYYEAITP